MSAFSGSAARRILRVKFAFTFGPPAAFSFRLISMSWPVPMICTLRGMAGLLGQSVTSADMYSMAVALVPS
jgi:hypothetical protein